MFAPVVLFFENVGGFIYRNRWAQYAVAAVAIVFGIKLYGMKREGDGLRKAEKRQKKQETKAIEKQERKADEIKSKAKKARDNPGPSASADRVRDDIATVIFDD